MAKSSDTPQSLRAGAAGRAEGVDRAARCLRGYVVAQAGPFKDLRGEFDADSLAAVVRLGNAAPKGLKSRLGHPGLSDDGLGKHLGRCRDFRMGTAADARTGRAVPAVRADLHFDPTASKTPSGDLAGYVMDLAESDPDALSSSLVLKVDQVPQVDARNRRLTGPDGEELPPLWRPTELQASDIVDTGDAVDALLSPERLAAALAADAPEALRKELLRHGNLARLAQHLLDGMFPSAGRGEVESRVHAWLARYLEFRYPAPEAGEGVPPATPRLDAYRLRLDRAGLTAREKTGKV